MTATQILAKPVGRKVSDGLSIGAYVNAGAGGLTIPQGAFRLFEGYFGLCVQGLTIPANGTGRVTLLIEQCEYETTQIDPAGAFNKGDLVYWDNAGLRLTATGTGNRVVGRVTQAKDVNNVVWILLGPQVPAAAGA